MPTIIDQRISRLKEVKANQLKLRKSERNTGYINDLNQRIARLKQWRKE